MNDTEIAFNKENGLKADLYSEVRGAGNRITNSENGIHAQNGAHINLKNQQLSSCDLAVKTSHKKDSYGFASVVLNKAVIQKVKKVSDKASGTTIQIQQ